MNITQGKMSTFMSNTEITDPSNSPCLKFKLDFFGYFHIFSSEKQDRVAFGFA